MKFRATLRDARAFLTICVVLRSFSRKALLRLHPDQIRVIALPSDGGDGAQLWCSCRSASLFSDLRIESKADNAIFCEIPDVSQLVFALKACEKNTAVVMKLAKIDGRQLLSISMQSIAMGHDTVHEVPIRVLTEAEIARIAAPPIESDVAEIFFPPLSDVTAFIDCAKLAQCASVTIRLEPLLPQHRGGGADVSGGGAAAGLDPLMVDGTTDATRNGGHAAPTTAAMTLSSEGVTSQLEMHYHCLSAPGHAPLPEFAVDVTVDLKRLSRFLAVKDGAPSSVTAHLAHRRALVLSAFAPGEINLVYYIPAVLR